MSLNAPPCFGAACCGGQSPFPGVEGSGDWNMRVNSPGPDGGAAAGPACGGAAAAGSPAGCDGDWNIRVNAPGSDVGAGVGGAAAGEL
jgi:hypothetical protein